MYYTSTYQYNFVPQDTLERELDYRFVTFLIFSNSSKSSSYEPRYELDENHGEFLMTCQCTHMVRFL